MRIMAGHNSSNAIKSLMVDATDRTVIYPAFELTFSSGWTYTSTGGMPVWPASGAWKLTDKNTIDRDGVALHIDEVQRDFTYPFNGLE